MEYDGFRAGVDPAGGLRVLWDNEREDVKMTRGTFIVVALAVGLFFDLLKASSEDVGNADSNGLSF